MKDERIFLQHMLDTAMRIRTRLVHVSEAQFNQDEDLQVVIVHLLQVIGEAARLVSDPTKKKMSSLPWKQITGMRHRLVHDYFDVDLKIVWETAMNDLDPLIAVVEDYLNKTKP